MCRDLLFSPPRDEPNSGVLRSLTHGCAHCRSRSHYSHANLNNWARTTRYPYSETIFFFVHSGATCWSSIFYWSLWRKLNHKNYVYVCFNHHLGDLHHIVRRGERYIANLMPGSTFHSVQYSCQKWAKFYAYISLHPMCIKTVQSPWLRTFMKSRAETLEQKILFRNESPHYLMQLFMLNIALGVTTQKRPYELFDFNTAGETDQDRQTTMKDFFVLVA